MERKQVYTVLVALLLVGAGIQPTLAQEDPFLGDPEPHIPGRIQGTGTHFEITDSEYLNIILESADPVNLTLDSVPEVVVMEIGVGNGVSSTWITLTGFPPLTTFYKYEDGHDNVVVFTTDSNGAYAFAQDLSNCHLVFIQPNPGTIYVPGDTDWGTWNPDTRTYTVRTDISKKDRVVITSDDLTLDGNGYTAYLSLEPAILAESRVGVTIKNLNVTGYSNGIRLFQCSDCSLIDMTVRGVNRAGIDISSCTNMTLTRTTAHGSYSLPSILIRQSTGSVLTGNTESGSGIRLESCMNTSLTGNTGRITIKDCADSTLRANTLTGFDVSGKNDSHFDNDIDTTNTLNGKPIYYVKNAVGGRYDSSTNAGMFYAINCDSITISDLTLTNQSAFGDRHGVYFWKTRNSRVESVTCSDYDLYLNQSSGNTITGNTITHDGINPPGDGIHLLFSDRNVLTGNVTNSVVTGIALDQSSNNLLSANTANALEGGGVAVQFRQQYCDGQYRLEPNAHRFTTRAARVLQLQRDLQQQLHPVCRLRGRLY